MQINGVTFSASLEEILTELQTQLHINGIDLLEKIQPTNNNVMLTCPYHSRGKERRPSAGIRKSDGLFNCFSADTKVLTHYGIKPIYELLNKPTEILNGKGEWEFTQFKKYGTAELFDLELTRDGKHKHIITTANHEWFVNSYHRLKRTDELKRGMNLMSISSKMGAVSFNLIDEGVRHGIIYGDGTRTYRYVSHRTPNGRVRDKSHITGCTYRVTFSRDTKKGKLLKFFDTNDWHYSTLTHSDKKVYDYVQSRKYSLDDVNYKCVPDFSMGKDYIMSFLAGYFACDGCADLMDIASSKYDELCKIKDLFCFCGVLTNSIRTYDRVNGTNYKNNPSPLYSMSIARNQLTDLFFLREIPKQRKYFRCGWTVVSVTSTKSIKDVYCCETSTQSFVLEDNILTHNCLACHETHSLQEVISYCFGHTDDMIGAFGWNWLLRNFATLRVEERKGVKPNITRNSFTNNFAIKDNRIIATHRTEDSFLDSSSDSDNIDFVSEEELDSYRYYHPYWAKRGITDEKIIELFDLGWSSIDDCLTFPIRDINGNCLFVAKRSTKTKFFSYPSGSQKSLYGLYEINQLDKFPSEVWITESMIDTLRLWQLGFYACAMNGTGDAHSYAQIQNFPCRAIVLATDMDNAGLTAREKLRKIIKGKVIKEVFLPKGRKDIGDCTDDEILALKKVI